MTRNTHCDHPLAHRPNHIRRRWRRPSSILVGGLLILGLLAGCGSDDPEEAFCDAGDSLKANIEGLTDIDIISEGTNALEEQFSAISSDVDQLRDSGADLADQEITDLDTAVDQLGTRLDALSNEFTATDAQGVIEAGAAVVDTAGAVFDKLTTTCG
ncbi:MAG: hypothetical protein GY698_17315 [Actinomycetia bacterium]|nr:hypothetical protein [Actinomycetes bacterium]